MDAGIQLIAETDQEGSVVCVWHWSPEDRAARPLGRDASERIGTHAVTYYGASSDAIDDFLRSRHLVDRGRQKRS